MQTIDPKASKIAELDLLSAISLRPDDNGVKKVGVKPLFVSQEGSFRTRRPVLRDAQTKIPNTSRRSGYSAPATTSWPCRSLIRAATSASVRTLF